MVLEPRWGRETGPERLTVRAGEMVGTKEPGLAPVAGREQY